jgi:membrane protein YdbS with pleckstrin-like domain
MRIGAKDLIDSLRNLWYKVIMEIVEIKKSYLTVWGLCILSVILIPVFIIFNGVIGGINATSLGELTTMFIPILEAIIILVCYIMAIYTYLAIKTRHYSFNEDGISIIEGILYKSSTTLPLYKIESIHASANILGNGTIIFNTAAIKDENSCLRNIEYIKNVNAVQKEMSRAIEIAKKKHGIKSVDTF